MTSSAVPDIGTSTQVYRIFIRATPQAIWDAITKPEWTQRWGYGLRDEYDLRPGGQYRGMANDGMIAMGMSGVIVDGEVIESDPPRKLVITWRMAIDPSMKSEGFTRLTYEIEEGRDGVSRFSVLHDVAVDRDQVYPYPHLFRRSTRKASACGVLCMIPMLFMTHVLYDSGILPFYASSRFAYGTASPNSSARRSNRRYIAQQCDEMR